MAKRRVMSASKLKMIPPSWEEASQEFLFWKQAQGLSERTLDDYRKHVKMFFNRFPDAYQPDKLKHAIFEYMSQPVKPATYNLRLIYLKAFFNWCLKEGIFPQNPLEGFKRRKAEGRVVNISNDTLTKLISLPDKKTFAGLRDLALLLLTLDTGIRPKEALSLQTEDMNLRSLEVLVRADIAKTRVSRTLPISPVTSVGAALGGNPEVLNVKLGLRKLVGGFAEALKSSVVSKTVASNAVEQLQSLKAQVKEYEDLLETNMSEVRTTLDVLRAQVRVMLDRVEPEADFSIAVPA